MPSSKKRSDCPISSSLDVWGDKWSLLIVRDLMFKKQSTYGEFLKSDEKIATNILASRLLMLEENGIISKQDHPDSKAKVLYKLTEKGINLLPLLIEINLWAEKYSEIPESQQVILNEVKKDKVGFIEEKIGEMMKDVLRISM
ncbi:winged helix-turn-helix transcriptional regulator [Chryseobacterium sp. JAH]|uniref:winged helix-turn-helix transcriptional regulator n=1 Tax=Chryseobacterium sp. JAH TaxID=1742858 RepID=UPI000740FDD5|nr:helix-turn-helix domain-containing protein [Chryseobacterium sp. JAH]KUJ53249.1 transcriptional regulator [Chryseobacterium sp. JAH]